MDDKQAQPTSKDPGAGKPRDHFREFSQKIHNHANSDVSRIDFLCDITKMLLDFAECDAVELLVRKEDKCFRCEVTNHPTNPITVDTTSCRQKNEDPPSGCEACANDEHYSSVAILPLTVVDETIGLVQLKSEREDYFKQDRIKFYEEIAQIFSLTLVNQFAHAALRERVKELTCLYNLAQLTEHPDITLEEILQGRPAVRPYRYRLH
ncbi:MAG: hypothetical protein ACYTF1_06260 [Planctomycetota bacterium]|jgi:hypothetical protein